VGTAEWKAALVRAIRANNVGAYQLLLIRAPEDNWADTWPVVINPGHPLEAAASRGHIGILSDLLGRGMSQESIQPALCCAAAEGHVSCMQLLVQHGADVNAGTQHFDTSSPLLKAMWSKCPEAVVWLLQQGAHVEPAGSNNTTLKAAVKVPALPCIPVLLRHGVLDRDGSALYLAARGGPAQLVQILLNAGPATVELGALGQRVAQASHITRLQLALCGAAATGQLEVMNYLLGVAGIQPGCIAAALSSSSAAAAAAAAPTMLGLLGEAGTPPTAATAAAAPAASTSHLPPTTTSTPSPLPQLPLAGQDSVIQQSDTPCTFTGTTSSFHTSSALGWNQPTIQLQQ
jgi:hypothetical protein